MVGIGIVLGLAVVVEALIEIVKGLLPVRGDAKAWLWPVLGAVFGVALCVLSAADVLALVGITMASPVVGYVVTGLLISCGSSFCHELWKMLRDSGGVEGA